MLFSEFTLLYAVGHHRLGGPPNLFYKQNVLSSYNLSLLFSVGRFCRLLYVLGNVAKDKVDYTQR